ncbi:twin-arginine translocase subunit TatC [Cellulomonas sp. PhB150]|uniref:twin-arginine translocase subunit TatC n=1 Tax=Cellulomonas sp. PhB150 TaxID=2485188 RepID=UPI000F4AC134|nr:twin-arginine translocase subunit TatC [Cellulomonas sp. PhB150]ROS30645.1 Sec-independent protein translocase TatC [Cellulomonas sp. PhB150]
MPLRAHLVELRRRVVLASAGILVGAVVGWFFYDPVFEALQRPINEAAEARDAIVSINFAGLATAIDMQVKVSFFLGVLISSPWWLYQLWAFINPGLNSTERRRTYGFLAAAIPMFLAGAAFAALTLPNAVRVLTEFTPEGASNLIDAQTYLSFVMRFVLAFGLAFLLPVIMVALTLGGVVRARTWARGWRWAILLAFTFAAIMTPTPDILSMVLLALPICALYFLALGIGVLHDRRLDRRRVADGLPRLDGTMPGEQA